jgi:hypothetical protein
MSKKADAGANGLADARVFFENNISAFCVSCQKIPDVAGIYLVNIGGEKLMIRVGYATMNHYDRHAFDPFRLDQSCREIWIKWHDTRLFDRYRLHAGDWLKCPPIYFPEPPLSGPDRAPIGCVYFVLNEGKNLVKIGKALNLKNRLSSLQTSSADNLCVAGRIVAKNPERLEARLHKRFNKLRVRGEWFQYTDELKIFITKEAYSEGENDVRRSRQETAEQGENSCLHDSVEGRI